MNLEEFKTAHWDENGVAVDPAHQEKVTEYLGAKASGDLALMREFVRSLGVEWLEAEYLDGVSGLTRVGEA